MVLVDISFALAISRASAYLLFDKGSNSMGVSGLNGSRGVMDRRRSPRLAGLGDLALSFRMVGVTLSTCLFATASVSNTNNSSVPDVDDSRLLLARE